MTDALEAVIVGELAAADDEQATALLLALSTLRPSTRKQYASVWRRFACHYGHDPAAFVRVLLTMTPTEAALTINGYVEHLRRSGCAPRTCANVVGAVLGMLRRWRAAGLTELDVRDLVRAPKVRSYGRRDVPDADAVEYLIEWTRQASDELAPRDLAIILLLHDSALRRSEVAGLRRCDYDPARRAVWIRSKGLDDRERQPVSQRAAAALAPFFGDSSDAMFRGARGRPIRGDGIFALLRSRCEQAELDPIGPHKLRHAGLTRLASRYPLHEVQRYARHASPDQTAGYVADAQRGTELADVFDE